MNSMDTASTATAPPVPVAGKDADPQHGKLAEKVAVRSLNFYYGDHRALKTVNVPLYDRKVMSFIGPRSADVADWRNLPLHLGIRYEGLAGPL
jgi:hypothetical protein